jgi:hypothetical protein
MVNKSAMKKTSSLLFFRFLLLPAILSWAASAGGQDKNLAIGAGIGYSITPIKQHEGYYDWDFKDLTGNFTPTIAVRYGNKISGVFKASYIRNAFQKEEFSQYGGTSTRKYETTIHQIYADLLFEHAPFGSRGFFYYIGPGFGIPVKVNITDEYWRGAWGPNPSEHTYDEYSIPTEFGLYVQAVFGMGGYIPVKTKNLISIECNFRLGLHKVLVNDMDSVEAKMIAVQFILGYLRRL